MSSGRAVFLDVDGTLTPRGSNVPPASAVRAIRSAREVGHKIFLCSGRNLGMLSQLMWIGFDGVIACSGGIAMCGDRVIYDCPMTDVQKTTAMDVFEKSGVFRTLECRENSFSDVDYVGFLKRMRVEDRDLLEERKELERTLDIRPMSEYRNQPAYKMVLLFHSMEQLEEPKRWLEKDFELVIQGMNRAGIINGELLNRRFDKGTGVRFLCESVGISCEDSVGFGDSNNDRAMLETVGLSFCMGDGSPGMQSLADRICPSVEEDGLYRGFLDAGLIQDKNCTNLDTTGEL